MNRSMSSRYFGIECLLMSLLWLCCLTIFVSLSYFILQTTVDFVPKHERRNNVININLRPEHVENENCDLFNGQWVPDLRGLLYTNQSCSTIPNSKNCGKHGRKDTDYLNWRWKPYGCELQKFDARTFLSIVQGKTLAFIGDSVARNQMESLLCLLSQEVTSIDMYKDIDDRFRTCYFPSHNFTMKVIWTKFFVMAEERVIDGTQTGVYDLQLDKLDTNWTNKLPGVDIAIISNGHWFFRQIYLYKHGNIKACIYCDAENISNVSPGFAVQKTFRLALKYINDCKECGKLLTLLRTFAPAHLENGSWNTGGSCNRTHPYSEKQINLGGSEWTLRNIQIQEIERRKKKGESRGKRFGHMDVTKAMLMRPDGHPDIHWDNQWMHCYSDCVHWCLPGPIDVWNDLLMAVLRKEDNIFLDDSREEA